MAESGKLNTFEDLETMAFVTMMFTLASVEIVRINGDADGAAKGALEVLKNAPKESVDDVDLKDADANDLETCIAVRFMSQMLEIDQAAAQAMVDAQGHRAPRELHQFNPGFLTLMAGFFERIGDEWRDDESTADAIEELFVQVFKDGLKFNTSETMEVLQFAGSPPEFADRIIQKMG